jgi:methionine-S-sulfoxide reductase
LYDHKITNYKNILLYFFRIHDPTTLNQQGNDLGSQYRSAIFYSNDFQKKTAEEVIKRVNQSKNWGAQVVTKLEKASEYYRGEEYHQDYLVKNHGGYTCHFPRKFKF